MTPASFVLLLIALTLLAIIILLLHARNIQKQVDSWESETCRKCGGCEPLPHGCSGECLESGVPCCRCAEKKI